MTVSKIRIMAEIFLYSFLIFPYQEIFNTLKKKLLMWKYIYKKVT